MGTQQLIREIEKLPITGRKVIIERVLKFFRDRENKKSNEKSS